MDPVSEDGVIKEVPHRREEGKPPFPSWDESEGKLTRLKSKIVCCKELKNHINDVTLCIVLALMHPQHEPAQSRGHGVTVLWARQ